MKTNYISSYLSDHPIFTLIIGFITIISLLLSVLFFIASIKKPFLVAKLHSEKTLIFSPYDDTSKMEVLFDGKKLNKEIVATNIEVWNAGRSYIKKTDILRDIKIRAHAEEVRILEIRKIAESRAEIDFTIYQENIENKVIGLDWSILEEGDGALLQVVHTNVDDINFTIEGSLVGQKDVSIKPLVLPDSNWINILVTFLFTLMVFMMLSTVYEDTKNKILKAVIKCLIIMVALIALYYVFINLYVILTMTSSTINYEIKIK